MISKALATFGVACKEVIFDTEITTTHARNAVGMRVVSLILTKTYALNTHIALTVVKGNGDVETAHSRLSALRL